MQHHPVVALAQYGDEESSTFGGSAAVHHQTGQDGLAGTRETLDHIETIFQETAA
jgi:hypothetical protein